VSEKVLGLILLFGVPAVVGLVVGKETDSAVAGAITFFVMLGVMWWGLSTYAPGLLQTGVSGGVPTITPTKTPPPSAPRKTGKIKVEVYDAYDGSAGTNIELHYFDEKHPLPTDDFWELIDLEANGELTAPARSFSSGIATIQIEAYAGMKLPVLITPTTYDAGYYPPRLIYVTVNDLETDDNGYFKNVAGNIVNLYLMDDLKYIFGGSEYTGFVQTDNTSTNEIFSFDVGCDNLHRKNPPIWIYADEGSATLDYIWVGSEKYTLIDITDLPNNHPLRKNAPSGYDYVIAADNYGPVIKEGALYYASDPRDTIQIKFQYDVNNVDTAIKLKFVAYAMTEYCDFSTLEFTYTINDGGTFGPAKMITAEPETVLALVSLPLPAMAE